jgi:hypothetical protein
VIGTAAGRLDFRARALRRGIESMVVVPVLLHQLGFPSKRRQRRHVGGVRRALYPGHPADRVTDGRDLIPGPGQLRQNVLTLAQHDHIGAQFTESDSGRRRCVRADADHRACDVADGANPLLRYAKFGRRATPEQVAGSGTNDREVRLKCFQPTPRFLDVEVEQLGVKEQNIVTCGFQQGARVAELQRKMRLATAEVDAPCKRPVRIQERVLHAIPRSSAGTYTGRCSGPSSCSQRCRPATPLFTLTLGFQPVARENARISDT